MFVCVVCVWKEREGGIVRINISNQMQMPKTYMMRAHVEEGTWSPNYVFLVRWAPLGKIMHCVFHPSHLPTPSVSLSLSACLLLLGKFSLRTVYAQPIWRINNVKSGKVARNDSWKLMAKNPKRKLKSNATTATTTTRRKKAHTFYPWLLKTIISSLMALFQQQQQQEALASTHVSCIEIEFQQTEYLRQTKRWDNRKWQGKRVR